MAVKEKEKIVSREFPEYIREPNPDVGLDESIKDLKPEQIEKTIMAVLGAQTARICGILETCIHCGLCSEACQWYLSSGKDPTFAPVAKMKMTAWEMLKRKGKVDAEFIKQTARIVFTECNLCQRRSMYCPYGLDITFILGLVRRVCYVLRGIQLNRLGIYDQRQPAVGAGCADPGGYCDGLR